MRFVVQRVSEAAVTIDGRTAGQIGKGFLVLIGVCDSDTRETADLFVRKLLGLRIFEDAQGKTNLSLKDVGGELLLVSQFTKMSEENSSWYPSLHCMQTAAKATVQASQTQETPPTQKHCMNT